MIEIIVFCLISAVLAGFLGFYYAKGKFLSFLNGELESLRNENLVLKTNLSHIQESLLSKENLLREETGNNRELSRNLAAKNAEFNLLQEKLAAQKQELAELNTKFSQEFQKIANQVLINSSSSFNKQTGETLELILKPLRENIDKFEKKIDETRSKQLEETTTLKNQISGLEKLHNSMLEEAKNLTSALKGDSKVQGNWGEYILEQVLEKSGLEKGTHYRVQEQFTNEAKERYVPDVIVQLPENKHIIIDSKVSLVAYERYSSSETKEERDKYLKEHIASLNNHIKELGRKNYQSINGINSPDFVLLFIPIEPSFTIIIKNNPEIYNEALEKNIVLVTVSTLLATLRIITNLWKQENQNKNVQEIAKYSGGMYDKFVGFVEDMKKIGAAIDNTSKSYENAMNKLTSGNGNLVKSAQKIKQLGAKTSKNLPDEFLSIEEDA